MTGYEMVLPMNSGAEAVETAVKTARKWGYQKKGIPQDQAEIIVCANNFHGRTVTVISFSTEPLYRKDFGPFTPGFKVIPFNDAEALEKAITPNTAAFLVEPCQAEAGILIPSPKATSRKVREICTKNNVLFIADEIQTGLGRTGKLFACEHERAKPDMIVIGKSLGGGCYPISAALADGRGHERFQAGRTRLDVRRQSAGLRRRPGSPPGHQRGKARAERGQNGPVFHGQAEDHQEPPHQGSPGQGPADRGRALSRRPAAPAGSAKPSRTPVSSARKRTTTSSVSRRRSSSERRISTGPSNGSGTFSPPSKILGLNRGRAGDGPVHVDIRTGSRP